MIRRGDVWWADLGAPRGSQPALRRPVVVVQTDSFNESRLATIVVASLTSNVARAGAPGNVLCRPRVTGLPKPSVINVSQISSVDRRYFLRRAGRLPQATLKQVDEGLRLVLGLAQLS